MTTPNPSSTSNFTCDDIIPPALWGKDHWSTLAYIETVMVDYDGIFQVGADAHMRSNRRNFRIMAEQCAKPGRPTGGGQGVVMRPEHGSRLADGQIVENHDDWNCIQDFAEAGLFLSGQEVQPKVKLKLSEKGRRWSSALRFHKMDGGTFSNFKAPEDEAAPEPSKVKTPSKRQP